jgi:hypothetical protein
MLQKLPDLNQMPLAVAITRFYCVIPDRGLPTEWWFD